MHRKIIRGLVAATALSAALLTASCGSSDPAVATTSTSVVAAPTAKTLIAKGAQVVDVRTPQEFAAGHVSDAQNIDVTAGDFVSRIDGLDRDATYVVYCHSGSRAAAALQQMEKMGFKHAVNGGGFDALAAAGVAVQ